MRFYTKKMREIALKNAAKYDWAKTLVKEATERADFLLDKVDLLYNLFPSEGVPRSATMSTWYANEQVLRKCPYCGIDIRKETRYGLWEMNSIEHPWKVQCPKCKSLFPSNDFGLLYKRGLNENGEYDRALALENNKKAVAQGEKDALINESFPDKDALWMVDDGFGWSKRDLTYGTIDDETKWAPIAYYHNHFWYAHYTLEANSVIKMIETFRDAYLYTGDIKYGRAGAILLDRAADLYPAYDHKKVSEPYSASHGLGWNGKICGSIEENFLVSSMIQSYDAFYPVMEDQEVIAYLSEKAKELHLDNPKTSAELLRKNCENNIVREAFRAVKEGQIRGNFGMQQKVVALAAVVLDDEAEVKEIIDWLKHPTGIEVTDYVEPIHGRTLDLYHNNKGGELVGKFVEEIDHDGFGGETGISYNKEWFIHSLDVAEVLTRCKYNSFDLFKNPRFIKMFDTFIHETIAGGTSLAIGDSGSAVSIIYPFAKEMLRGYQILRDPKLARAYHYYMKGDLSNIYIDMFTDAEELAESIKKDIETYGPYHFESDNLTGFGLTVLREGQHYYDADKQYDTWVYYGRTNQSHSHMDMLQLGVDAYGLNMSPDLGYPEATAFTPNRYEWIKATISHNTVVVNGDSQAEQYTGKSRHYDSTDRVKLVDVDGSGAYEETDIYRRTAVQIAVDDTIGYTLDFFRVKGGDSHMYSFHSQSYQGFTSDDVKWVPQVDENGDYVGTYAGRDVAYGHDPNSSDAVRAEKTLYPRGFTWLTEVNKGSANSGNFTIDFKQTDFRSHAADSDNLHLRYTAVNDWIPDSVDITKGLPPRTKINECIPGLDYMFIHRNGENLDTLFTSLLQPYKGEPYIAKIEPITPIVKDGVKAENDVVKVVKVTLVNGLTDYVVYATNNQVTYCIEDSNVSFDFRGFVGVYHVDETGKCVYGYINDGDLLTGVANPETTVGAYTGTVVDFKKEFVDDNHITVKLNQVLDDTQSLAGRYAYVDSESIRNTVYRIERVTKVGEYTILDLGNTSLVERMVDGSNIDAGFTYAITEGDSIRIPISITKE